MRRGIGAQNGDRAPERRVCPEPHATSVVVHILILCQLSESRDFKSEVA